MKFWDSSAVVQLLVEQQGSAALRALLGVDPVVADAEPRRLPFVCRDERLCGAADREGLPLV